jgi:hypothetical protein
VGALRGLEETRRAALPPPAHDHLARALAVRDVMALADRVEIYAEIEGSDANTVFARDAALSSVAGQDDDALLGSLEREVRGSEALKTLRDLRALLARYAAGEFWPPETWFDIPEHEP